MTALGPEVAVTSHLDDGCVTQGDWSALLAVMADVTAHRDPAAPCPPAPQPPGSGSLRCVSCP